MERKTISIMKACELVGVSRRTIYNWLSSGKIEYVRTAGGSVRIFVDTLWRDPHHSDRPAVNALWQTRRPEPGLMPRALSVDELLARRPMDESPELRLLFHRLNNQLGIILAHAELLEAKAPDDMNRARAAQVVASALEAMGTAKEIRIQNCNNTAKSMTSKIVEIVNIFDDFHGFSPYPRSPLFKADTTYNLNKFN